LARESTRLRIASNLFSSFATHGAFGVSFRRQITALKRAPKFRLAAGVCRRHLGRKLCQCRRGGKMPSTSDMPIGSLVSSACGKSFEMRWRKSLSFRFFARLTRALQSSRMMDSAEKNCSNERMMEGSDRRRGPNICSASVHPIWYGHCQLNQRGRPPYGVMPLGSASTEHDQDSAPHDADPSETNVL